jgi:hypothetical protein
LNPRQLIDEIEGVLHAGHFVRRGRYADDLLHWKFLDVSVTKSSSERCSLVVIRPKSVGGPLCVASVRPKTVGRPFRIASVRKVLSANKLFLLSIDGSLDCNWPAANGGNRLGPYARQLSNRTNRVLRELRFPLDDSMAIGSSWCSSLVDRIVALGELMRVVLAVHDLPIVPSLLLLVLLRELSGSLADATLPGLADLRHFHNLLNVLK